MTNNKTVIIYTSLVLTCIISFYFVFLILQNPYIGISAKKIATDDNYYISKIFPNSWAQSANVKIGDKVLLINGDDPNQHFSLRMFGNIEKIESILLEQDGKQNQYNIRTQTSTKEFIIHLVYPLIVYLFCSSIGLYVYWRYDGRNVALYLLLFMISLGISYLSAGGSARDDLFSKVINIGSLLLLPIFFTNFLRTYFYFRFGIRIMNRMLLYLFIGVSLFVVSLFTASLYFHSLYNLALNSILILFIMEVIIISYILVSNYYRQQNPNIKLNFKILLFGIGIAFFPFIFLNILPNYIKGEEIISGELSAIFILIIPLTIVYLLMAKQFIDIDFVISRVSYNVIISLIFTIVTTVILILLIQNSFITENLLKFIMILFVSLNIFLYFIKDVSTYRFKMSVSSGKNFYQYSLYRYIEMIKHETSNERLLKALADEVKTVLGVKKISIQNYKKYPRGNAQDDDSFDIAYKIDNLELGDVLQEKESFYLKIGDANNHNIILCSSPKPNLTMLNSEEKEWLAALSYHTYISLENIRKIDELVAELKELKNTKGEKSSWASKFLFSLSEQERVKLSKDIHDTILQESIYLYRKLEGLGIDGNDEWQNELTIVRETLLDNISLIREVCHELRPPFLVENGINASVEELIAKVQLRTNIVVDYHSHIRVPLEKDIEQCLNIYRIIQELLNNAVKHSKASKINLSICQEEDALIINYADNGIGFNVEEERPGSLGLISMKERAFSFEGTCLIQSEIEKGVSVHIRFPLTQTSEARVNLID